MVVLFFEIADKRKETDGKSDFERKSISSRVFPVK